MLEEVIEVMTATPDAVTAPLAVSCNTVAMLAKLGGPPKVNVYSTQVNGLKAPYIFLYDSTERRAMEPGLGGDNRTVDSEIHILAVECACIGGTPEQAKSRANALKFAVESQFMTRKSLLRAIRADDLGGTSSYWHVANLWLDSRSPEPRTIGPGVAKPLVPGTGTWTGKAIARICVVFNKNRSV